MRSIHWGMWLVFAALAVMGTLACSVPNLLVAQATVPPTRTPRPTWTPVPTETETPIPTRTATPAPTSTPTKPPTARPATKAPPTVPPKVVVPPTVSPYEFHVNPPTCSHSGLTFIKGIVYLDKSDPSQRYTGAIVALGPPDGSTIYAVVKSDDYGEYTFVLGDPGQGRVGTWAVWLVDPSHKRKSDIGGPINTNGLPPSDPKSCWAGNVDFWR